jgi:hypothetical protein
MSDYLQEIEAAYSRCREKWSMLSAVDFQLALDWEKKGIPVTIILRAIDDCCKKYKAKRSPGKINSLRYFEQAVDQHFAAWQKSRIGSHDPMSQITEPEQNAADAAIERCEEIILKFGEAKQLAAPELREAIAIVIDAVFLMILQIEGNGETSTTDDDLRELGQTFDQAIAAATPPAEREELLAALRKSYPQYADAPDAYTQLLIKDLYDRLNLPRLTLYQL